MKRFATTLVLLLASTFGAACDSDALVCGDLSAPESTAEDREPGRPDAPERDPALPDEEPEAGCSESVDSANAVHAHLIAAIELNDDLVVPTIGDCVAGGAPAVDPSTADIANELFELSGATRDLIDEIPTADLTEATVAEAQRIELMASGAADLAGIETCEDVETVPAWIKCAGPIGGAGWYMCDCSTDDDCKKLKKRCSGKIGNGDQPGSKETHQCSIDESSG